MPTSGHALVLARSLLSDTHKDMTLVVVEDYQKELFAVSETTKKMEDARDEID